MTTREYLNKTIEEHFDGKPSFLERKAEFLKRIRAEIQYHAGEAYESFMMNSEKWYNYHDAQVRRLEKWEKVVMKL